MSKKKKARKNPDCPHCSDGAETYRYLSRRYKFDVDLAREIVSDGREPVEVEDESLAAVLDTTSLYREHLLHVDLQYPGIIAHVFFPMPDGSEEHGHALIDGNHRAARCQQLGRPFFAYVMSEEESRQILLHSPQMSAERNPTTCSTP